MKVPNPHKSTLVSANRAGGVVAGHTQKRISDDLQGIAGYCSGDRGSQKGRTDDYVVDLYRNCDIDGGVV